MSAITGGNEVHEDYQPGYCVHLADDTMWGASAPCPPERPRWYVFASRPHGTRLPYYYGNGYGATLDAAVVDAANQLRYEDDIEHIIEALADAVAKLVGGAR